MSLKYLFSSLILISANASWAGHPYHTVTLKCRSKYYSTITTIEMFGVNLPGKEGGDVTISENGRDTVYGGCRPVEILHGYFIQCTLPPADSEHAIQVRQYIIQNMKLTSLTTDLVVQPQVLPEVTTDDWSAQCKIVKNKS